MVFHKFAVGDRVRLLLDKYADSNPQDLHTISRRLPPQANVCQYRVKRVSDGQERAVSEQQLVTASDAAPAGDMHFKAVQAQQDRDDPAPQWAFRVSTRSSPCRSKMTSFPRTAPGTSA
jgi:hypothetical protein